jgi:predicted nuclease with TOPRIM domain
MTRLGPISLEGFGALPRDVVRALRLIPEIAANTGAMARHTAVLADVADAVRVLETMDSRMATIEKAMPELVEVQRHLAQLPETMDRLDESLKRLSGLMERILVAFDELSVSVETLQEAIEPMGQLASRIPGQRKGKRQ